MSPDDLEKKIQAALPDCQVSVTGDGYHYQVVAIGDVFEGMSPVKKQQLVYAPINDLIVDGTVHAVSIKTYTQKQWADSGLANG